MREFSHDSRMIQLLCENPCEFKTARITGLLAHSLAVLCGLATKLAHSLALAFVESAFGFSLGIQSCFWKPDEKPKNLIDFGIQFV